MHMYCPVYMYVYCTVYMYKFCTVYMYMYCTVYMYLYCIVYTDMHCTVYMHVYRFTQKEWGFNDDIKQNNLKIKFGIRPEIRSLTGSLIILGINTNTAGNHECKKKRLNELFTILYKVSYFLGNPAHFELVFKLLLETTRLWKGLFGFSLWFTRSWILRGIFQIAKRLKEN